MTGCITMRSIWLCLLICMASLTMPISLTQQNHSTHLNQLSLLITTSIELVWTLLKITYALPCCISPVRSGHTQSKLYQQCRLHYSATKWICILVLDILPLSTKLGLGLDNMLNLLCWVASITGKLLWYGSRLPLPWFHVALWGYVNMASNMT